MLDQIRLDAVDLAIVRIPTSQADLIFLSTKFVKSRFWRLPLIYSRDNLKAGPPRPLRNNISPSEVH